MTRGQIKYPVERVNGIIVDRPGMMLVPAHIRRRQVRGRTIEDKIPEHWRPYGGKKRTMHEKARAIFRSKASKIGKAIIPGRVLEFEANESGLAVQVIDVVKKSVISRIRKEMNAMLDRVERGL